MYNILKDSQVLHKHFWETLESGERERHTSRLALKSHKCRDCFTCCEAGARVGLGKKARKTPEGDKPVSKQVPWP